MSEELLPIRWSPREWLGALGDLGTFVPIYLALVALNGLPPARSLLLVGAAYVAASLYFRIPMPVQPLKAMGAIAIANGFGVPMLSAAGLWMGAILLALSRSGGIERLSRYFTRPIVKGIQLGVGLMLLKVGLALLVSGPPRSVSAALSAAPRPFRFLSVLWLLVLPQLPLTLGNAVFAVSDVARGYFGDKARRASPENISLSLGLANLTMGVFGGLPVCHGSGGLTAHYRFGARTAGSTVITGSLFIVLALAFGGRAHEMLGAIPPFLLGAMVVYVGICHALLVRGLEEMRLLAWMMGFIGLATGNLAYALGLGLLVEGARRRSRFASPMGPVSAAAGFEPSATPAAPLPSNATPDGGRDARPPASTAPRDAAPPIGPIRPSGF